MLKKNPPIINYDPFHTKNVRENGRCHQEWTMQKKKTITLGTQNTGRSQTKHPPPKKN